MKIAILGAGALGSILAAHLVRSGEEVALIARGARAKMLRAQGVRITGLEEFVVPVPVVEHPEEVREADALMIAVKTYDTEEALDSVRHMAVDRVLSVQNGVLKNEQIAAVFGWEHTLGAAVVLSGEVVQPDGVVRMTVNEAFHIGELPGGTSPRVETLASALEQAGIRTQVSANIRTVEWSKYVFIASGMALSALSRMETYRMFQDPGLAQVGAMIEREVGALASALDIPLQDDGIMCAHTNTSISLEGAVANIQRVGRQMQEMGATAHKISTLQDLERGRRLEVEEILGYAMRKGAELNLPVPTVATCYYLIAGLNRGLGGGGRAA